MFDLPDDLQYLIWRFYFSRHILTHIPVYSKKYSIYMHYYMRTGDSFEWDNFKID